MEASLKARRSVTLLALFFLLMGCDQNQFRQTTSYLKLASEAPSEGRSPPIEQPGEADGAEGSPAPAPADPPPQTLGSYPWLMIIKYEISANREMVKVRALVLEEDDPPGIPVFSGYIQNKRDHIEARNLKVPILVEDSLTGLVSFTIPYRWFFSNKTEGILTGPFYQDASFPLCDFDDDDLQNVETGLIERPL